MGEKWEKERIGMVDEESMRTKRIGFRNSIGRGMKVEEEEEEEEEEEKEDEAAYEIMEPTNHFIQLRF